MATELERALLSVVPSLKDTVLGQVGSLLKEIDFSDAGQSMARGLMNGFSATITTTSKSVTDTFHSVEKNVTKNTENIADAFGLVGMSFDSGTTGIIAGLGDLEEKTKTKTKKITDSLHTMNETTTTIDISKSFDEMSNSMEGTSKISGILKGGLIDVGIALAGMAIDAAIGYFQDLAEKEENFKRATQDLEPIISAASSAITAQGESAQFSMEGLSSLAQSTDDVIAAQANMADGIAAQFRNTATSIALVESYQETINRLGEQEDLTATEQAELTAAVYGYNEATGSTIAIVDSANGVLSQSVESINRSTEAWIQNARVQAAQESLMEVERQKIENSISLAAAQEELARVTALYNEEEADCTGSVNAYAAQLRDAQKDVDDLTRAEAGLVSQEEDLLAVIQANDGAIISSANSIAEFNISTDAYALALYESGAANDEFSAKLSALGISTLDLAAIGSENFGLLAQAFMENADSLYTRASELGVEMPSTLQEALDAGIPGVVDVMARMGDDLAVKVAEVGPEVIAGLANGMSSEEETLLRETYGIGEDVIEELKTVFETYSPSKVASEIGGNVVLGLGEGLGETEPATAATSSLGELILETLSGVFNPEGLSGMGLNGVLGFATGIFNGVPNADSAGKAAALGAKAGMQSEDVNAFSWGSGLLGLFSRGLDDSALMTANKAGLTVAANAKAGMKFDNDTAWTWGRHLVEGFASGITNFAYCAINAASNLAAAIASILHFTRPDEGPLRDYEQWMPHMVQGLSETLRLSSPLLIAQAKCVAENLSEALRIDSRNIGASFDHSPAGLALHSDIAAQNNYSIGDISYTPDSRIAQLMDALFAEVTRTKRMGVMA